MKSVWWSAAICLALVACGPGGTTQESTTTTESQGLAPTTTHTQTTATSGPTTTSSTTTTAPEPPLEIVLENGDPVGGVVRIEVEVGDEVRFIVTSDRADELHVHGFDRFIDLPANEPVEVTFIAEAPGIFEIESHRRHRKVAELVVR